MYKRQGWIRIDRIRPRADIVKDRISHVGDPGSTSPVSKINAIEMVGRIKSHVARGIRHVVHRVSVVVVREENRA